MKIIFGSNEIPVKNISATENYLSFTAVKSATVTFAILSLLDGYHGNIDYYENDTKTITYSEYGYEFMCIYSNNEYTVRMAHKNVTTIAIEELQEKLDNTFSAVEFILTAGI